MARYYTIVQITSDNPAPADNIVNTWAFTATGVSDLEDAHASLLDFYNAIDGSFSADIASAAGAHRMKSYDLADAEPRTAVIDDAITLTPGTGEFPREMGIALSFHSEALSGVPRARRHGRVFLGPWGDDYWDSATGFINGALTGAIVTAAENLLTASQAAGGWDWCVWSRVDDVHRPVVGGWVDNAPDVIRSRGANATTRTVWP